MYVENRKFSERDDWRERSGEVSSAGLWDWQIIQRELLLFGYSAIHAYNKPGLSASERERDRGGLGLREF